MSISKTLPVLASGRQRAGLSITARLAALQPSVVSTPSGDERCALPGQSAITIRLPHAVAGPPRFRDGDDRFHRGFQEALDSCVRRAEEVSPQRRMTAFAREMLTQYRGAFPGLLITHPGFATTARSAADAAKRCLTLHGAAVAAPGEKHMSPDQACSEIIDFHCHHVPARFELTAAQAAPPTSGRAGKRLRASFRTRTCC